MEEQEIATRFLRKINSDNNLVVIDCSVSSLDSGPLAGNELNGARNLTCRFRSNGREASKRLILLQSVPQKWIEVVEKLEEILARVSSDNCQLTPLRYECSGKDPYSIEEDLTFERFKEVRNIGLGSLQIARYLAALHAASIVMFRENPGMRDEFESSVNLNASQVIENVSQIVNAIDSWSGRKWSQTLKDFLPNLAKCLKENEESDEFSVLNHGKPVCGNILMRYRGCGLWDVRFRHFQDMLIHSPVYDIMCFIMSSVAKTLRFTELDHTLKYYHASFTQFCLQLGVPKHYTYDQFRNDFKKYASFGFFVFCCYCGPGTTNFDKLHFLEGLEFFRQEGLFRMR